MAFPTSIGGPQGYGDTLSFAHELDVAETIALLDPNENPFTSILMQIGNKKPAVNPTFDIIYDTLTPEWFTVNNSTYYSATATNLVLNDASGLRQGDILEFYKPGTTAPETEQILVIATPAATGITVTRSFRFTTGSSASTIQDETLLHKVGQVVGSKSTLATMSLGAGGIARDTQQIQVTNYCQLFEEVLPLTRVEANTGHYGTEDIRNYKRKKMMQILKRNIENAFLWGVKGTGVDEVTALPGTAFTTGGFNYWLNQTGNNYVYPSSGGTIQSTATLTQKLFQQFLRLGFRYGSPKKWLFVSPLIAEAIDSWNLTALRTVPGAESFGVNTKTYYSSFGEVAIVMHKMLESPKTGYTAGPVQLAALNSTPGSGGYAFLIDMQDVRVRHLQNMDLTMATDVGVKGDQVISDIVFGMLGLEMRTPAKHAILKDVTAYGA